MLHKVELRGFFHPYKGTPKQRSIFETRRVNDKAEVQMAPGSAEPYDVQGGAWIKAYQDGDRKAMNYIVDY